jgi:hypothetical protein
LKKAYVVTYIVWIVLALAVAVEAGRLGFGTFSRPGPGFLPFLAAIGLAVLAAAGLIQSAIQRPEEGGSGFRVNDIYKIGLVAAVLFIYVMLWELIGFFSSAFLLLLFLFRCVEPLRWRNVFVASGLTLAFTYILFSILLGARLPTGRLWTCFSN